jgi:hypothetical protein
MLFEDDTEERLDKEEVLGKVRMLDKVVAEVGKGVGKVGMDK